MTANIRSFPREPLAVDALRAATSLLGARLIRGSGPMARAGRIVEVEAYAGQQDLASHARSGRTSRNMAMFGPPGHAYVYLIYGMYHCLNIVTGPEGTASAVLIRAIEPELGLDRMRLARETRGGPTRAWDWRLGAGPGLVGVALSVTRADDGVDLCDPRSDLRLEPGEPVPAADVAAGPRVGIGYAPEPWVSLPWRLWIAGNRSVSRGAVAARNVEAGR